jgi:hypothetical protein
MRHEAGSLIQSTSQPSHCALRAGYVKHVPKVLEKAQVRRIRRSKNECDALRQSCIAPNTCAPSRCPPRTSCSDSWRARMMSWIWRCEAAATCLRDAGAARWERREQSVQCATLRTLPACLPLLGRDWTPRETPRSNAVLFPTPRSFRLHRPIACFYSYRSLRVRQHQPVRQRGGSGSSSIDASCFAPPASASPRLSRGIHTAHKPQRGPPQRQGARTQPPST